ncbi:glycosyltransferase [Heyndrickxia sporothermodurans]|uniref:glycosyltransferase n=1 Tax=Heyndrickxia sporothermodurans TaxID=46224 RepID=UPI002E1E23CF|nr:glycosyltransferase [Heyndrickxia sporothermodurans]
MKKKTILVFIYQMGAGGAARTLLNIINNLDRTNFNPILVTLNYNGSYEKDLKSDVKFIKLKTERLRWAIFPLAKIIRKERADIVFSTIPNYNIVAIFANLLSFSHAKNVIREADNLGGNFFFNLKLQIYGLIYKKSSQIISLSEGVKENLIRRYKIRRKDIKVIYNPVDLKDIRNKTITGSVSSDHISLFKGEEKIVITAGRLVEQKDHKTLLHAFAKVNEQVRSKLIILGEGPLKDILIKEAEQLNIQDRVFFIGFQRNPYIYFKQADLFVLTSIHEGFSHVIAEALATGIPVVSTDCKSGPREVLSDGKYGILCRVGDVDGIAKSMLKMLAYNNDQIRKIVDNGYKRAEDFDAKQIVKEYENVFLQTT